MLFFAVSFVGCKHGSRGFSVVADSGMVYRSNKCKTVALNAKTGKVMWTYMKKCGDKKNCGSKKNCPDKKGDKKVAPKA